MKTTHSLRRRVAWLLLTLLVASWFTGCLSAGSSGVMALPVTDAMPDALPAAPLCRMGLNVSSFPNNPFYASDFDLSQLQAGWYIDYRAAPSSPANNGAEYVMVINVFDRPDGSYGYGPTGANLDAAIAAYPGAAYVIGNEPDRRVLQDDVLPENYAYIYHDVYHEIKSKDPTAKVWAGAIIQPTPLRLQYLDRVLAAYEARYNRSMPVDGWAIHAFLLNERDCAAHNHDINVCWGAEIPPGIDATEGMLLRPEDNARVDLFTAGILRFRTWMAANGYRNMPLYVTEYGVLMPDVFGFPPGIVNFYMRETFDYMLTERSDTLGYPADDNRLVQRFSWFSTFDPEFNGQLFQSVDKENPMAPPFVLTQMGEQFRDLVAKEGEQSDLALLSLQVAEGPRRLVATIANSGSRLTVTQATVRFYQGPSLAEATQIGEEVTVAVAGCGATEETSVLWDGVQEGDPTTYRVWAEVSDFNFVDARGENNVISEEVFVNGLPLYLPLIEFP